MVNLNFKLLTNKAASTLTTEEVLGAHVLDHVGVQRLQADFDRVVDVGTVVLEADDGPRTLNLDTGLGNLVKEDALDLTLVDQGGEGVASVDEAGAARPAASAADTRAITLGVPESDVVDLGRLEGHDSALQAQVAQNFG